MAETLPKLGLTEPLLALGGPLPPGGRFLDAGCGKGETVALLRAKGLDAAGVDLAPPESARHIIRADMRALPFAGACMDGVVAECSVSVCGDAEKAFSEFWRVLRPGGALYLSDVYMAESSDVRLSLPCPATLPAWEKLIAAAGFRATHFQDRAKEWKEYYLELLWNGVNIKDIWCKNIAGCFRAGGYFCIRAIKEHPG